MQPQFRITADGHDITTLINDRLLLLRTTDKPGLESDEFELRLDARDGALALPARGAALEVHLGYAGQPLSRLGRYTVDEVELSGPPDTLVIRGKASDLRGSGKSIRSGSWEQVTLQRIVAEIAARNGWQAVCPVTAQIPRVDQYSESDFNFVTRLARLHDCTAKLANGQLLVLPRQGGLSASGKPLGVVSIARSDVSQWQFRLADKSTHKAVRARHQDSASGRLQTVELENRDAPSGLQPVYTDRHLYPSRAAAEQAAKARLASFNRDTASVRLDLPGRTDLFAERSIEVSGFLPGLDGTYLVESVEQVFTSSGWRTTLQCNGGREGKARAKGAAARRTGLCKA
ncbi:MULTISPECIES: contractile injection system protein, VgrG/Pvc8 family [unclassified Pseudomonas]|uniref:phage late control D family protein n=1 Tax=unclassified Pseudomonas TaxID=196821 RepID=UPI0020976472|nr:MULTISPECIES: contractile injection system protein, VgrG/Pvc8 family [unclassified Pseudomonas]MCO7518763.1 contractile injection system protein, VgrG/Pvc8 family [Pseudomonas sp. 1]MCO7540802.1 contractile injection system protein, VgrG/Pvc8 family [Pseudomonas sp. VA159-2]